MKIKLKHRVLLILSLLFISFYTISCASTTKKASIIGTEGNDCYENNTCNNGFICENHICIQDKCLGITCSNDWEECIVATGNCVTKQGYCSQNSDCNTENNELCTLEHICSKDLCLNTDCSADSNSVCNRQTGNCDCIENFHNEENSNECLPNSKNVSCLDPDIENSEYIADTTSITWDEETKLWSQASKCDWTCKTGFYKTENDVCTQCNCETWEVCEESGNCSLNENRCTSDTDCEIDNQICNQENYCIDADNPCEGQVCNNNGICGVVQGQAICACNEGFYNNGNLTCVNPCEGKLCSNQGTCVASNLLDAHCECNENYFADDLNCVSPCTGHWDCNLGDTREPHDRTGFTTLGTNDPRGVCTASDINTATCDCNSGYSDEDNDLVCTSLCSGVTCGGHGTCIIHINRASCECDLGYEIDTIDSLNCVNIDDCSPNPCLNGGDCLDGINSYTCLCIDDYSGDNCEIENPCGGNCEEWEYCSNTIHPHCELDPGRCNSTLDCQDSLCRLKKDASSTNPPPIDGECICNTLEHTCETLAP